MKGNALARLILPSLLLCLALALAGCATAQPETSAGGSDAALPQSGAESSAAQQEEGKEADMAETRITITIGDVAIPATLNGTVAAQSFAERLPFEVNASKGEFDYCGMAGDLPYDRSETQAGWRNGDIGYARGWFALFHDGEDESSGYTSEMIIGHIDDGYLDTLRDLPGSVTIKVDLAED